MAVSVMAKSGFMQGASLHRCARAPFQPCKAPVSFVRPMRNPARACGPGFHCNGCGSNMQGDWEQQAMKRMMSEMETMAKQWRDTGKVNGTFYWPGGPNISYNAARNSSSDTSAPTPSPSLPLDVVSTDGFFLLYADIPGLAKPDLSIKLSKERVLTVYGDRTPPVSEGFSQKERVYGPFSRSWTLPEDADSEGISAKVSEGVLTITVPKKQPEPEVDDAQEIAIS